MKKSTAITIIAALSAFLVLSFVPRMVQYFAPVPEVSDTTSVSDSTSEENSEPTFTRVEAQRYEIVFPGEVNGDLVYGGMQFGNYSLEDVNLQLCTFTFDDSLAISSYEDSFVVWFYVYADGSSMSTQTDFKHVEQGEYGRYVISETQVADEPVAYTLEPIYEYVLDSEDEGLYYERVEAERYEIQFPHRVNGEACYGGLFCGQFEMEDMLLISSFISLDDADCIYNEIFYLSLYVFSDGSSMQERTLDTDVEQGEYGRYVISETQVADEPVAYTFEPIYEYVLVE